MDIKEFFFRNAWLHPQGRKVFLKEEEDEGEVALGDDKNIDLEILEIIAQATSHKKHFLDDIDDDEEEKEFDDRITPIDKLLNRWPE
jgi:hypothetical protein